MIEKTPQALTAETENKSGQPKAITCHADLLNAQ